MARITKDIVIEANNRDFGKVFLLVEPSAIKGEQLFNELYALCGDDMTPQNIMGRASTVEGRKLWDSLLDMVKIYPNPDNKTISRPIDKEDIEEVSTIIKLKSEVIGIITGFIQG